MIITRLSQPGVILYTPDVYTDDRGYFTETFNVHYGINAVQGNESFSKAGTVRGLHYQTPGIAKLVWVSQGKIVDCVFNLNTGQYLLQELDSVSKQRLLCPAGYAHGFMALEDSVVHYVMDGKYNPMADYGINPSIVTWPEKLKYISPKDEGAPAYDHKFFS